jgi:nucleoid DNA-binding protein
MGSKKDAKLDIVNAVVLETGYSKENVENVVDSFLAVFQDKVSDGGRVYIRGFGQMTGIMQKKRYFDINQRAMDETIQPTIIFKPTSSFLNLVRHGQNGKGDE